jgi:hypothetical protein
LRSDVIVDDIERYRLPNPAEDLRAMSQELHYTSVPRGLKPGSRGFCTVAATPRMPGPLADRLEALSGYQPVYAPHDPRAAQNPIVFSHLRLTLGGKVVNVLSRIGPAGQDYSGRPNKYAHHVVVEGDERPEAGPAWLLAQPGFMQLAWEGDARELQAGRVPPAGDCPGGTARAWQAVCGDGGWAGVLAESFLADPKRPVLLFFRPGMELLPLFVEALALLPPARRWDVDFSTYFTGLQQGVSCTWRALLEGSAEAESSRRLPGALVLDLTNRMGHATGLALVHWARTGERAAHLPDVPVPGSDIGRRVPNLPVERAGGSSRARGQAPALPSTPGSYELLPELARLAPGASRASTGLEPSAQRRRRSLRVALVVSAASLIPLAAVGYFLIARGRSPVREVIALETERARAGPPVGDDSPRQLEEGEEISARDDRGAAQIKPAAPPSAAVSSKTVDAQTKALDATMKGMEDDSKAPSAKQDPPKKVQPPAKSPNPFETPLFLALGEPPASSLGGHDGKVQLRVPGNTIAIKKMELLGLAENLRCESPGPLSLAVFSKSKSAVSVPERIATFEATARDVSFYWNQGPRPRNERQSAFQNGLRDCILKITPVNGDPQYCVLRGQPVAPQKNEERLTEDRLGGLTEQRLMWDASKAFSETSRRIHIAHCKLWTQAAHEELPLERSADGSWVSRFQGEDLLTVKLGGSEVLALLKDKQPRRLQDKIAQQRAQIKALKKELESLKDEVDSNDAKAAQKKVDQHKRQIAQTEAEKSKLDRLFELYHSQLDAIIVYEVEGHKFRIAQLDLRQNDGKPQPPN